MGVLKNKFCPQCLHMDLKFSGEDGDYSFTVSEYLDNQAPAMDALFPGMSSQGLYSWLISQGGCLDCIYKVREDVRKNLGSDILKTTDESLSAEPKAIRRLEELRLYINTLRKVTENGTGVSLSPDTSICLSPKFKSDISTEAENIIQEPDSPVIETPKARMAIIKFGMFLQIIITAIFIITLFYTDIFRIQYMEYVV